jgi:23S rRNA (cytosine1962-C5)-methyltransferase
MDIHLPVIADGEDKSSIIKNRIRKNYKHARKWAKRTLTNCFRIYDRDIKEYPIAIDFYDGRFSVQFFSYDKDRDEPRPEMKEEIDQALMSIFEVTHERIFWRTRYKRDKLEQYEKRNSEEAFFTVLEYGMKFKVNLDDYLDTGLFLDHRETRQMVAKEAVGKRLLNLFAYTSSFSVHAASQGARSTKSVDMSNTYTDWSKDNFLLNHLSLKTNEIIRADCLKFLEEEIRTSEKYDVIVIDPPTISRSKKMEDMFDIQEDYIFLIKHALRLLSPFGTIYFSTNSRKFKFDESQFLGCKIIDITQKTIPFDFHNQKIHYAWKITRETNFS